MITLDKLPLGRSAFVAAIEGDGAVVQRLYEMGLLEGEPVEVIGVAPFGDPIEIRLRDYRLSLRRQEAARVRVTFTPPGREAEAETNIAAGQPFSTRIQ